jgi:hypothetical protein
MFSPNDRKQLKVAVLISYLRGLVVRKIYFIGRGVFMCT